MNYFTFFFSSIFELGKTIFYISIPEKETYLNQSRYFFDNKQLDISMK
jgi:hypothetical protein